MKINIKFDNQDDYNQFMVMLKRIYKSIEIQKHGIGRFNYQLFLEAPVTAGRPKATITDNQIAQIIDLLQKGNSINSISNETGISRRQIYKIIDSNKSIVQKYFDQ